MFNHITEAKTFVMAASTLAIALFTIGMGVNSTWAGSDQPSALQSGSKLNPFRVVSLSLRLNPSPQSPVTPRPKMLAQSTGCGHPGDRCHEIACCQNISCVHCVGAEGKDCGWYCR